MRLLGVGLAAIGCSIASPALAETAAGSDEDLSGLSIEQLAQIPVRSASKRDEPLSQTPSALYVIDHNQIVRSGAVTIPEMLRLAPNLQVYQSSPAHWVVTARGLNGNPGAQSFSNKLLVLIDGRTVYTPLFSGVYWDLPDLLPDDIERIEVISGPGATLWGANAVNGVINIVTRSADSTSGGYVDVQGGSVQQVAGVRVAGRLGPRLAYRAYARLLRQDAARAAGGGSAEDSWNRIGGGFRLDWTASARDAVTLQGDVFGGHEDEPGQAHEDISGHNLVLRWDRDMGPGQQLQAQVFYDHMKRDSGKGGSFFVDTYDMDLQHSMDLGNRNQLVWGGGARLAHYRINGTAALYFVPASRNLILADLFVQDTFAVSNAVSLTGGVKAESDPYVGLSVLPNVKLAIKTGKSTLVWAAVSRAVRSPTPFDEDVQERLGSVVALSGNRSFRTEKLTAYELGLRSQPLTGLSFSIDGFYHSYNDLRSVEVGSGPATILNLYWANRLAGHSYGVEAWMNASPLSWWTLSAGTTILREQFHFKPGATAPFVGTAQNGLDPGHQFTLRSSMNLGRSVMFDLDFRAVGRLKQAAVPAYAELGGRLAWNVSDAFAVMLSGSNLLHARHVEYSGGDQIARKVLVGLQWRH
jgi:iron complex outermembrane receptor protein